MTAPSIKAPAIQEYPADIMKAAEEAYSAAIDAHMNGDGSFMDHIAAAILAERERHQWQPIDTAPKDGTIVDLLTLGGTIAAAEWWIEEDGEAFWSCDFDDKFITHWRPIMPLPSPPEKIEDGAQAAAESPALDRVDLATREATTNGAENA